jgi:HlyD family secretion protein
MSRKPRLVIAAVLVLGAASAAVLLGLRERRHHPLVLYGNVDIREVDLAFRQPGRIQRVLVDEGSPVKAGDLVAELDAKPYRDALAAAKAEVLLARAEVEKLQRGNRPQEIAQAEEAVRQAEAVFRNADTDCQRQSGLLASGSASQKTVDSARSARDQAAAELASARKNLDLKQEGWRREDKTEAAARLAAAEAAQAQAETALDDTCLVAPADAVVLVRDREPGSMVATKDAVFTLSLRNPLYVRAYVGERDLGRFGQGAPVRVRTDSGRKVYHGTVGFISPRAEFTPKSVETTDLRTDLVYRLRIVVGDGDEGLAQGMPVTVEVDTDDAGR